MSPPCAHDDRTVNALLRVAALGIDPRKPLIASQIGEVARCRTRVEDLATITARAEAVRLARRVVDLNEEPATNQVQMIDLIHASKAAVLLDRTGIGPVTVAIVYAAWSHAGRVRSEAAVAAAQKDATKEIRRCLKRYLARQLYRTLERLHTEHDAHPQVA